MLQYWSRIRVRLTLPDFEVLTYFQKVDSQDQRFTRILSSSDCEVNPIILPRKILELKELEHSLTATFFYCHDSDEPRNVSMGLRELQTCCHG